MSLRTTLFSGLAGHKTQAEEITQKDAGDQQSTDMTGMDSSFMDMDILNEQLAKAEKKSRRPTFALESGSI